MSESGEVIQAILGLVVGGIIFISFGAALSGTALDESKAFINFELWGVIFILGAFALAAIVVGGVVISIVSRL